MAITKCEICNNENLIRSGVIPELYYCVQCDNFLFYGEEEAYSIQDVLRAVGEIFPDLILNFKSLGILADLCAIKDNFLDLYANIISSDIIDINSLKQEAQVEGIDSTLMSYSHILEQSLKIDYLYCEYIIKVMIYALGINIPIEAPNKEEKSIDSNIIKYFKQSTKKIIRGGSVELSWDVRLKHAAIKLQIGENFLSIKNPRYTKRISFSENTKVTLIVENKKNHHELARKQLEIYVVDPVEIIDFSPSRYITLESLPIHLKWNVKNAEKVILLPTNQDITSHSIFTVHPVISTTYTIKASNECSCVERSCSISVKKLPSISHIKLPCAPINQEFSIKIRLPDIQINSFPLNITIGNIKAIPIISYILPLPEEKQTLLNINVCNKWFTKLKSLFYYFEKTIKNHGKKIGF